MAGKRKISVEYHRAKEVKDMEKPESYLIQDTTREQREIIVAESLGAIEAACDGCSAGLAEMYQEYIDGKKELRQINAEFNARYVSGREGTDRSRCPWQLMK